MGWAGGCREKEVASSYYYYIIESWRHNNRETSVSPFFLSPYLHNIFPLSF
jgi:hypothetical protein